MMLQKMQSDIFFIPLVSVCEDSNRAIQLHLPKSYPHSTRHTRAGG